LVSLAALLSFLSPLFSFSAANSFFSLSIEARCGWWSKRL
jgi:hypothetical protein